MSSPNITLSSACSLEKYHNNRYHTPSLSSISSSNITPATSSSFEKYRPTPYSTTPSSNITPANRSYLEKIKEKYQKLKDNYVAMLTENKSLKEELQKYQVEVRNLRKGFSENGVYCGRNTTSRSRIRGEWDQTDLCNNDIVKSFCKNKMLPNYKFLRPEQLKYEDDKRSLCFKIYAEIQIPDTIKTPVDKIFYWNQKLVPMINTKLVEVRSNFNSFIKKQYLADKDSKRPDAYNLSLHEALTSASSNYILSNVSAVCRFMDKYVTGLYGTRSIVNWITKNKGKHFLDMATMSDIAYTVAVIENSYEAWDEEHGIDKAGEGEEQVVYQRPQKSVKTKFTNRIGKKRQCNMSGWNTDGIIFYDSVVASWKALLKYSEWTILEEEWKLYEEKTNFGHSIRRKKNEHHEPDDEYYYDGMEQCSDLPLLDKFVFLEGDEDFIDERPSAKRMRESPINHDGYDIDLTSLLGDDYGGNQTQITKMSPNGDDDTDSDGIDDLLGV